MSGRNLAFSKPALIPLRWLIDPGRDVPPEVAASLQEGVFASPWTLLIGAVNGLTVNTAALFLGGGGVFAALMVADLSLVATRLLLFKRLRSDAFSGRRTHTDLYLLTCISWCAVQGATGFFVMLTGIASLQVICTMTVAGLVGPICMRNYGSPRLALALIGLSLVPLVCGAALSGNPWLLILPLQAPVFLFGAGRMLNRLRTLSVSSLLAEQESQERARRDALTGLLNRTGLAEAIDEGSRLLRGRAIYFYLDLDGFKLINDLHGHQAGDEVLQAVANRLLAVTGSDSIVARLGGDEFMIVAPGLLPDNGDALARRVIQEVAGLPYAISGFGELRVGISVGFACSPEDGVGRDELAQKADVALYEAKAAGKGVQRRYSAMSRIASRPTGNTIQEAAA